MLSLAPEAEISVKSILLSVHSDDRQRVFDWIYSGARNGDIVATEFRLLPDGRTRWFVGRYVADSDPKQIDAVLHGAFTEVTAQRSLQDEVKQIREEVTHLMRISTLGKLSGAIAHQLHQPLTAILSNAQAGQEILRRAPADLAEISAILDDIVEDNTRAAEVIDHIRCLMRKSETSYKAIDLNASITAVVSLLASEMAQCGVAAETHLAKTLPRLCGDQVQIQQVFLNLILNACEAMNSTPLNQRILSITSRVLSWGIEVTVADRGTGLIGDAKRLALEPFFTTKMSGLGLGLSICQTIIASHGGTLTIDNGFGGGTIAVLRFPKANQASEVH